jgi:hypothetical protein
MSQALLHGNLQRVVAEVADVAPGVGYTRVLREGDESLLDGSGCVTGVGCRLEEGLNVEPRHDAICLGDVQ